MITTVYSDLESCEAAVRSIIHESGNDNPFLALDWLKIWCRHFCNAPRSLYILLFSEGQRSIGFAAFYRIWRPAAGLHEYHLVGSRQSSYLDIACSSGYEESVLRALLAHFRTLPDGAIAHLSDINNRFSRCFDKLTKVLSSDDFCSSIFALYPCPLAVLPASWDEYFAAQRDKKSRKNLRRSENQISRLGLFQVSDVTDPALLRQTSSRFQRIHAERFGHTINPLFSGKSADFFSEALPCLNGQGLSLSVAELDGIAISFLMGFRMGSVFIDYAPAFDPAFDKLSVGSLHLAKLIESKLSEGFRYFDFSKGDAPYKRWWANDETTNYLFLLRFNLGLRGRVFSELQALKINLLLWLRSKGYSAKLKRAIKRGIRLFDSCLRRQAEGSKQEVHIETIALSAISQQDTMKLQAWSYKLLWTLPLAVRKATIELVLKHLDSGIGMMVDEEAKTILVVPRQAASVYRICY